MIFRGYVKTNGKGSTQKYKNGETLLTLEEARKCESFAGILAKDYICIDIDDGKQAEVLMTIVEERDIDCKVVQTTRGKHFFFKNNGKFDTNKTGIKLACGLTADIKIGSRNGYAVCKVDGEERFCEWGDDNHVGVAPDWLSPVQSKTNFNDMAEGDGRDSALFSYILRLQSAGLSKEDAIESIKIINRFILKDKMSDADIERITRDEAFAKPVFFEKGHFKFDTFSKYLESEHSIKRINGALHVFREGFYQLGGDNLENLMIQHIPDLNRARRKEVLDYLNIMIRDEVKETSAVWVAFKNGLLNLETNEFKPFTPDVIVTNLIPYDYVPDAYHELVDKTLDRISCNDVTTRNLLEELVGSCLYRSNMLAGGKAFILTGSGANGKSTFLDMVIRMLGRHNVSVMDLKELNERFGAVMLVNKCANIGDDIGDGFIDDSSVFKKIVTGQHITAEQKNQPKFEFLPYAKMIFSANSIPRIGRGRDSSAIVRRLVIIPFKATFKPTDPDYVPFIGEKLSEETAIQYLINLGVKALKRVLETNQYSTSETIEKELREFEETNNPILGFFAEAGTEAIENQPTKDVYTLYSEYCIHNGLNPMGKGEFSKQVKRHFDLDIVDKKINGVKYRIFIKG